MKRFLLHCEAFGVMFTMCFGFIIGISATLPFLSAFIAWDTDVIIAAFSSSSFWWVLVRVAALLSGLIALAYAVSDYVREDIDKQCND